MRPSTLILVGAALSFATLARADDAAQQLTPDQELAAYPQRLADRPIPIGHGILQLELQGSYSASSATVSPGYAGPPLVAGFGEIPNLRYGLTDKWELTLLGLRYNLANDGQGLPGLAIRAQLHDFDYQATAPGSDPYPYAFLRPGVFLDLRDRLPDHFALNGSFGYIVSYQTGSTLTGQPIPLGSRESTELVPMSVDVEYSPLDLVSFSATGGYNYDVLVAPLTPSQSDLYARAALVVTPSNRLDLRLFFQGNWFGNQDAFVPEVGVGVAVRL